MNEKALEILKEEPDSPIQDPKRIISLRNQIIYGYDSVSDENIRGFVMIHLPKLREEIEKLIK